VASAVHLGGVYKSNSALHRVPNGLHPLHISARVGAPVAAADPPRAQTYGRHTAHPFKAQLPHNDTETCPIKPYPATRRLMKNWRARWDLNPGHGVLEQCKA